MSILLDDSTTALAIDVLKISGSNTVAVAWDDGEVLARLRIDRPRDEVLRYADVNLPTGRLVDRLRAQQTAEWPTLAVLGV